MWSAKPVGKWVLLFQKHKLNIRAPTRINPVNRFGETMFRYTRARLAENERTWCLLMEAYIRVRLSHFRNEAYTHYTNHGPHFREFARLIEGDWENSLKQYSADKAALLLEKRHEEECKEKVAQRDATIFLYLPGYGGGSEATGAFFFLNTYGGFLRWRIWATYSFFSIQHAFIDFECFCAFLCKV